MYVCMYANFLFTHLVSWKILRTYKLLIDASYCIEISRLIKYNFYFNYLLF